MLNTLNYWRKGIRFYVALGAALVTLEVWWWASVSYAGSVLYATRMEEVFAWLATGLLVLAVSIGPVYAVFPRLPLRSLFFDARRMLGISATWFAVLHVSIAYFALFKHANPLSLPQQYQRAFLVGLGALAIMLAMTFTSFDKAFTGLGIWWFRLHRLVYVAVILVLLHAFLIGVHATQLLPLVLLSLAAAKIFGLHAYDYFVKRSKPTRWQIGTMALMFVSLIAVFSYGFTHV